MKLSIIHIIFGIRLRALMIVYHLHNLQQVILVQFLQPIGEFLHVDVLLCTTALLGGIGRFATHAVFSGAGFLEEFE